MKKKIMMVMMLMISAMTFAQEIVTDGYTYDYVIRRLWFQAHVNSTFSMSEDMRYNHVNSDAWTIGYNASIGYNFNAYWGVSAQVGWNKNIGCTGSGMDGYIDKLYSFRSIEPSVNATYNLSNGFLGYKHNRKNNLYLYFGPTMAITSHFRGEGLSVMQDRGDGTQFLVVNPKNRVLMGGNFGLNYVYRLSKNVAFNANSSLNLIADNFNGRSFQLPVDGHVNLGVGVCIYLTKGQASPLQHKVTEVVRTEYVTKIDTVYNDIQTRDIFPVFFDENQAEIRQAEKENVKAVADAAKANPQKVVYVIGYADAQTDKKANRVTLAKSRAQAIVDELTKTYGIPESRIVEHDMGNKVTPYVHLTEKNRATICIVTKLNH